ncbi:hypothetical protein GN958_ATG13558 [Phytophthora infestans]|uniref:Uncharacterized protein n=1 Tax=Phytophthora infestans TaxID=4787 RepID=A0A8S9U8Q3_PHYIN|nr:hypothetical protein GN958_ATG13558 [Phytophthora infestans]
MWGGGATDEVDSAVDVQKAPVSTMETAARPTARRRQSKLEEARTTHEVTEATGPLTRTARRRLEAERATATAPQDQGSVAVAEYEETKDENAKDVTETNKATDDDGTGTRGGSLNGGVYGSTCRLSKENCREGQWRVEAEGPGKMANSSGR